MATVTSTLCATASHELQVYGAYSVADSRVRGSFAANYGLDSIDYAFTDYGGKLFWRGGFVEPGIAAGIYSSVAARSTVSYGTAAASASSSATGATYVTGDYRLGLAWVPLQVRARFFSFNDWVFVEAGFGPAYGFGAAEYKATMQSGGTSSLDSRYHKFSEWGFMTSLAVGFDFKLVPNLALQIFVEGAHIYAKIRNPDLTQTGSIVWSQFFVRPGLAVVFTFSLD